MLNNKFEKTVKLIFSLATSLSKNSNKFPIIIIENVYLLTSIQLIKINNDKIISLIQKE